MQRVAFRQRGPSFVAAVSGGKRLLFHDGEDNVLSGKLIGGNWSDTGYYGITDDNRVCLSLLEHNGAVRKYRVDGAMSFELLEFRDGNHL